MKLSKKYILYTVVIGLFFTAIAAFMNPTGPAGITGIVTGLILTLATTFAYSTSGNSWPSTINKKNIKEKNERR